MNQEDDSERVHPLIPKLPGETVEPPAKSHLTIAFIAFASVGPCVGVALLILSMASADVV